MALLGTTALAQTTSLLAGSGEASQFAVLVNGVNDPVDARIAADSRVAGINHNNFEEFVGTVLCGIMSITSFVTRVKKKADLIFQITVSKKKIKNLLEQPSKRSKL